MEELLIGLCLGGLALPFVFIAFGDLRLAAAVAIATTGAGTIATSVGLLLSWLLSVRGRDPALGCGPVATIIPDLLSLLIYFFVVRFLVR